MPRESRKKKEQRIFNKLRSAMYRAGFKNIKRVGMTIQGEVDRWDAPIRLLNYLDKHYVHAGGYGSHTGHPTFIKYKGKTEDITYKSINDKIKKLIVWYKGGR